MGWRGALPCPNGHFRDHFTGHFGGQLNACLGSILMVILLATWAFLGGPTLMGNPLPIQMVILLIILLPFGGHSNGHFVGSLNALLEVILTSRVDRPGPWVGVGHFHAPKVVFAPILLATRFRNQFRIRKISSGSSSGFTSGFSCRFSCGFSCGFSYGFSYGSSYGTLRSVTDR